MITRRQCVAARWMLRLRTNDLAEKALVAPSVISKFERCESELSGDTARRIERAFQRMGISFVEGEQGPGIFYPRALDDEDARALAKKRKERRESA